MVSALSQLRVVASWYALLGVSCSIGAVALWLSALLSADSGTRLSICITAAVAFSFSAVMSFRYRALSAAGRSATLAVSMLLALSAVFEAGRVTLINTIGLGMVVLWGVAGVCSLCPFLLWRQTPQESKRPRTLGVWFLLAIAAIGAVAVTTHRFSQSDPMRLAAARVWLAMEKIQVDPEPDDPPLWFFTLTKDDQRTKFGNFPSEGTCWEALVRKIDLLRGAATYGGCSFTQPAVWTTLPGLGLHSLSDIYGSRIYRSRIVCEADRSRIAGQCIPLPPETRILTFAQANDQLQSIGSYPDEAACETDLRVLQNENHSMFNGRCAPVGQPPAAQGSWNPSRPSVSELAEAACPSPSPSTTQDWKKKHTALVEVCAGVQMDCGKLTRENFLCYERNYSDLPIACATALVELECTARGFAVAAKQADEDRANNVGHPDCTPDQTTISDRKPDAVTGAEWWNATCKGKVYLCSGRSWAYSCAPVAK